MLYLTPDDRLILQNVAIEHLQSEFPDPLLYCEVYMTKDFVLAIECFDTEILNDVRDYLSLLQYWAWQITGALQIHVTHQDELICQVQTRRNLDVSLLKALEFESSVNSNLMTNATLEAPTTIASTTASTTAASQDNLTTELLLIEDLEQRLSAAMKPEQIREAIATANFPRYVLGNQVGVPLSAVGIIFRDWAMQTERQLLETPAPSMLRSASELAPMQPANGSAEPSNGRNGKTRAARTPSVKSSGNTLSGLKINLNSYKVTAQLALDKLAPNNLARQQKMAREIAEERKSATAYTETLLNLYSAKGRSPAKVKPRLLQAFSKIASTAQPAVEAVEQPAAEAAAS